MNSPFISMEPAAVPLHLGGSSGRVRVAYGTRRLRRVAGAGLAVPGCRRVLFVGASLEPLDPFLLAQEDAVALHSEADDVHVDVPDNDMASAATSSPPSVLGRTVRVKFVIKKQCPFGQSFHLVGDDPALGLWDPSEAIALDWSEGHDWTVEKDLPVNRLIEFKLLLQDSSGELHWQNGPNRSLQTGETANKLVVYEDWDDVKNQIIAEEEGSSVGLVETLSDDGKRGNELHVSVAGNQEINEDESTISDDDDKLKVDANISVQEESVKALEADQTALTRNELKIQDELHDKVNTAPHNVCVTTCADNDCADQTNNGGILSNDGVPVKNGWTGAFERELLWGWKALQQLLMNLGFKIDTT